MMQIITKLFRSPGQAVQLVMLARGVLNIAGFHQIVAELCRVAEQTADCGMLIDLVDAFAELDGDKIDACIEQASLSRAHRIAFISPRDKDQFNKLSILSGSFLSHGFQTAVFYDEKIALEWLHYRDRPSI
jgi:hypothetical protein